VALGLADGIGSTSFVARELIGAERIVRYSSRSNLLDRLAVPTIRNGLTGPFRGFPSAQLHSLGETSDIPSEPTLSDLLSTRICFRSG